MLNELNVNGSLKGSVFLSMLSKGYGLESFSLNTLSANSLRNRKQGEALALATL
jgi:hypothetical protein